MRYHIVIYRVPDRLSADQIPFYDTEFDSDAVEPVLTTRADHMTQLLAADPEGVSELMTERASADLRAWQADRPWAGFGDISTVDPDDAFLAGHEAGFTRGMGS